MPCWWAQSKAFCSISPVSANRRLLASGVEGRAGDFASVALGTGAPVFVVGLLFGLLYDRYRRLLPLIAAHWGIDAMVNVGAMLGLPL